MHITVKKSALKSSSKKIVLITNLIKQMNANQAIWQLSYLNKAAAKDIAHLVKSGLAIAKQKDIDLNKLFIKEISCNTGPALKRRRIIERGKATAIRKRSCHIKLTLSDEIKDQHGS